MLSPQSCYCRYKLTGAVVRIIREGYNGWYVLLNNYEQLVPNYYLEEL